MDLLNYNNISGKIFGITIKITSVEVVSKIPQSHTFLIIDTKYFPNVMPHQHLCYSVPLFSSVAGIAVLPGQVILQPS